MRKEHAPRSRWWHHAPPVETAANSGVCVQALARRQPEPQSQPQPGGAAAGQPPAQARVAAAGVAEPAPEALPPDALPPAPPPLPHAPPPQVHIVSTGGTLVTAQRLLSACGHSLATAEHAHDCSGASHAKSPDISPQRSSRASPAA